MKNESENNILPLIKSIGIGLLCSAALLTVLLLLTGYALVRSGMSDMMLNIITGAVCAVSVFAGSFITSRSSQRAGIIMGIINPVLCFALLSVTSIIMYDVVPGAGGFIRLGIMLLTGMAGGMLGVGKVKPRRKRR